MYTYNYAFIVFCLWRSHILHLSIHFILDYGAIGDKLRGSQFSPNCQ